MVYSSSKGSRSIAKSSAGGLDALAGRLDVCELEAGWTDAWESAALGACSLRPLVGGVPPVLPSAVGGANSPGATPFPSGPSETGRLNLCLYTGGGGGGREISDYINYVHV